VGLDLKLDESDFVVYPRAAGLFVVHFFSSSGVIYVTSSPFLLVFFALYVA